MNILPKKRWHVRTKENIARVRRDEAAAQEDEKKRHDKLQLAESEARINFLRRQTGGTESRTIDAVRGTIGDTSQLHSEPSTSSGFDLFADYKSHVKKANKDLEKEKQEEQEKYEKQIGYLTYLGQGSNEALKVRSWYEVAPKRSSILDNVEETCSKQKFSQDPLTLINALISTDKKDFDSESKRSGRKRSCPASESKESRDKKPKKSSTKHRKHKHKSHKKSDGKSKDLSTLHAKRDKLSRLRKERLLREATEQRRQEQLFAPTDAVLPAQSNSSSAFQTPAATPRIVQKYNSQFNPKFAKQNMP